MQVLIIDNDIAYRNGVSMAASNGKGFQPDELSKAVKPYYHGESVGTEHYGMGL